MVCAPVRSIISLYRRTNHALSLTWPVYEVNQQVAYYLHDMSLQCTQADHECVQSTDFPFKWFCEEGLYYVDNISLRNCDVATQCFLLCISLSKVDSLRDDYTRYCTARQCSPLRRKSMECSIINPALSLLMKHLVIGQRQKAPIFLAFHWSPHGIRISIGQHFLTTRVVHLLKRTEITLITKADLITESDQAVRAVLSCNSWFVVIII